MRKYFLVVLLLASPTWASAKVWLVGQSKEYKTPSAVAPLVSDGDTILIDAGLYLKDVAVWSKNNLVFRCAEGYAHLEAQGTAAARKGVWVISGDNAYVEGIEFSGCAISEADGSNGAGIRFEAHKLTCRRCYFHDNQEGILTGNDTTNEIDIEACEFDRNGVETGGAAGFQHNIYVGRSRSCRIAFSYFHRSIVGHEIKSRAKHNYILYNKIDDETGDGSYSINLPNGGESYVIGNSIQKGANTANSTVIDYGSEGLINGDSLLYFGNNTVVTERNPTTFFHLAAGSQAVIANNIFAGGTHVFDALGDTIGNVISLDTSFFHFVNPTKHDYRPIASFLGFDLGVAQVIRGRVQVPNYEYVHPMDSTTRLWSNEVGAFNLRRSGSVGGRRAPLKTINYPNPFETVTAIILPERMTGLTELRLFNDIGVQVYSVVTVANGAALRLDGTALPIGTYCYTITSRERMVSGRLTHDRSR